MNKLAFDAPCSRTVINVSAGNGAASESRLTLLQVIAVTIALLATAVSFGIAAYSSWLRGGTLVQQVMTVALAGTAVLYVHLIPMGWRVFTIRIRIIGGALWCVGIVVLMVGQVTFFVQAQRDAGNQRAALVPAAEVSHPVGSPHGRSLSEIAGSRVQVVGDLARINARRCMGDCPSIAAHKAKLSAQLAALDAETVEAKRREAEEDRLVARVEHDQALRESLRADPVASQIALWLGTTAQRLELVQAIAFAVVLEGSAVLGWLLVSIARGRGRDVVASGRNAVVTRNEDAAVLCSTDVPQRDACATGNGGVATAEDERQLEKIHNAVLAGMLHPTQEAIRKLLRCRQPTAGKLNRLYGERYGSKAPKVASPPPYAGQSSTTQA